MSSADISSGREVTSDDLPGTVEELQPIDIEFVHPRQGRQLERARALMDRTQATSTLNLDFIRRFRDRSGISDPLDQSSVRLLWRLADVGEFRMSSFEVSHVGDHEAVLGSVDCQRVEEDLALLEENGNFVIFCDTDEVEERRQEDQAPAKAKEKEEQKKEVRKIQDAKDRAKKAQKAASEQGPSNTGEK